MYCERVWNLIQVLDAQSSESTTVEQAVACMPVTQLARVRSPVGTSFLGEVFSGFFLPCKTNVRKLSAPRSSNIIWLSLLSSLIIHYGRQWPDVLTRPETSNMHTYILSTRMWEGWLWWRIHIRGSGGPRASWRMSYGWGKIPKNNLTQQTCLDRGSNPGAHAAAWSTAV